MTDRKLVFLIAVAAGAVSRADLEGRRTITAQVVIGALKANVDDLSDEDFQEAADEYLDYQFQTTNKVEKPRWLP